MGRIRGLYRELYHVKTATRNKSEKGEYKRGYRARENCIRIGMIERLTEELTERLTEQQTRADRSYMMYAVEKQYSLKGSCIQAERNCFVCVGRTNARTLLLFYSAIPFCNGLLSIKSVIDYT